MDALAAYDDSNDEQEEVHDEKAQHAGPAHAASTSQPVKQQESKPVAASGFSLPPPDFDGTATGGDASFPPLYVGSEPAPTTSLPSGSKRPLVQAQGTGGQQQAKAAKTSPAQQGPATKGGAAMLIPPQLRGRSNVSTEDVDNMFTKKSAAAARAAAKAKAEGSASFF